MTWAQCITAAGELLENFKGAAEARERTSPSRRAANKAEWCAQTCTGFLAIQGPQAPLLSFARAAAAAVSERCFWTSKVQGQLVARDVAQPAAIISQRPQQYHSCRRAPC